MKKILAYLLVLVSLMTLFCGTAGAEEENTVSYSSIAGIASILASVSVKNVATGVTKNESLYIAHWTVVATCRYEGENNADGTVTKYPRSAWASNVYGNVTTAGGVINRIGEPSESTETSYVGAKPATIIYYYKCKLLITYAPTAWKANDVVTQNSYHYGSITARRTADINTKITFDHQ